jgi:hypothetical protein
MSYTGAGQLIEAWDYNRLTWGGNTTGTYTSTPSNLSYVWGVGNGALGYGQDASAMTVVAAGEVVTATQWSTFVQRLNLALAHQSGAGAQLASGSNIGITAGATIQYFANVATAVTTVNTNAALFSAQGSTLTGTNDATNPTAAANSALSYFRDVNVTFSSVQAARYFFNAGGQINYVCSATDNAGTSRSQTMRDMVNQVGGLGAFRNTTNSGRTGTGGTIVTNNTSFGYRNMVFNSPTTIVDNDVAGTYSAHDVKLQVFTGSNDTTSGANGSQVVFRLFLTAAADDTFGGAINITLNVRADVVFPETTYLNNVWGTPTITFDST